MKISYIELKQYKYELSNDLMIQTNLVGYKVSHAFFSLDTNGLLTVKKRYKWDGVSGPMYDSDNSMIGGCVHDAFYQMLRLELLPVSVKDEIDLEMRRLFKKCKMWGFRAGYAYHAVDSFGANSCIPGDIKIPKVITLEC